MIKAVMAGAALAAAGLAVPAQAQETKAPAERVIPDFRMGTKPQELYMAKIVVSDLQRSYDFYTKVIGLKLVGVQGMAQPTLPKPGDPVKDFMEIPLNYSGSMADPLFVLILKKGQKPTPEGASATTLGFKVADSMAVAKRASDGGYKILRPVSPVTNLGMLLDPDGYQVELVQGKAFGEP